VKAFSHEEGQHGFFQFQLVTLRRKEFDFAGQKLLRNFQLVLIAQSVKHDLLVYAGEYFGSQRLLGASENMPIQMSGDGQNQPLRVESEPASLRMR
jgi:hypothetical protein